MRRYLLALGILAATMSVGAAWFGHLVPLSRPVSADLALASGVITLAIAARVSF